MELLLSILTWPDGAKPDIRAIDADLAVGRGDESGWVLFDPEHRLSRRHCLFAPYGEAWRVTDLSLNGTFINDATEQLGREKSHELHDGDRIRIGAYVIEARYQTTSTLRTPAPPRYAPFEPVRANSVARFHDAPSAGAWASPPEPRAGHDLAGRHDPDAFMGPPGADHSPAIADIWHPPPSPRFVLPDDFDPATAPPSAAPSGGATSPNRAPAGSAGFVANPEEYTTAPASLVPPPDWDPATAEPARSAPRRYPATAPSVSPVSPRGVVGNPDPSVAFAARVTVPALPDDWDPATAAPTAGTIASIEAPAVSAPAAAAEASATTTPLTATTRTLETLTTDASFVTTDAAPDADGTRPSTPISAERDMLAGFLRGVGLSDIGQIDPAATMERIGGLLRMVVDRLRALRIAREAIKREFRILNTQVNLEDNNPIKFSDSTDTALRALLTGKTRPEQSVQELLDGIRLHELAMVAAMRDAVTGLLDALNPARVRGSGEESGLATFRSLRRKARAFEQYEALHARTVAALTDDFDSVFGKAFARAYERVALEEQQLPGRQRR